MNWINIQVRTLRSPEYIGSDPLDRATWINLLAHCCEQENGGRISRASEWKDRQWQQVCGVTLREVKRATKLIMWEGSDLIVSFYPIEMEEKLIEKREVARVNGRSGGRPKKPELDVDMKPTSEPTSVSVGNLRPKAKGKERESKERESKPVKPPVEASDRALGFADWFRTTLPNDVRLSENWRDRWAACYDQMVTLDKRTPEQIAAVCKWARSNEFWQSNFLSPMKLRERKDGVMYFDTFQIKMNQPPGKGNKPNRAEQPKHIDDGETL